MTSDTQRDYSGALRRFIRFVLVGGAATTCQYAILVLLVELLASRASIASTIGAIAGAAVSYALNRYWTFETTLSHAKSLSRFAAMVLIGLALNYVSMHVLTEVLPINYLIAQLITTGLVLLSNYVLASTWVFRNVRLAESE